MICPSQSSIIIIIIIIIITINILKINDYCILQAYY